MFSSISSIILIIMAVNTVYAYRAIYGMYQSKMFGTFSNLIMYLIYYFFSTYWLIESYDISRNTVNGWDIFLCICFEWQFIHATIKYINARKIENIIEEVKENDKNA